MPRNERLVRHRIARNWYQRDVAEQLGVTVVTVERWERGYQQPSAYHRVKLCQLFGTSPEELGLLEVLPECEATDAGSHDTALPTEIALWTVSYARNPHFTGRDDLLAQLTQQFSAQDSGQPTGIRLAALTQSYAIKGLGGVGKTQIAVEYAYRSHQQGRYTHTIWINAASEEAILTSFTLMADSLPGMASSSETDQRKLVKALIRWLEQCEQPWLLIVDNADDLSFVPTYLPARGNGHILFTTRASAVGSLALSIEVDCMGVMEGTHLLLRRALREALASDSEINEAINIVVKLAQFPLALDQAGAYIASLCFSRS
jgi:transcriptional regulator with XRE-family HTH domain